MFIVAMIMLVLGVSITLHELGHYLAARKYGVVPTAFAVGFGPVLLRWKRKSQDPKELHTEFRLCLLPFGGYCLVPSEPAEFPLLEGKGLVTRVVSILLFPFLFIMNLLLGGTKHVEVAHDEGCGEEPEEEDRSNWISERGPLAEFLMSLAGPMFNLGLAWLCTTAACLAGGFKNPKFLGVSEGQGLLHSLADGFLLVPKIAWTQISMLFEMIFGGKFEFSGMFEGVGKSAEALEGLSAQLGGFSFGDIMLMVAGLNVLLAWTNFLPLPGLDGSHMLLAGIRSFFRREHYALAKGWVAISGVVLIGGIMAVTVAKDIRYFIDKIQSF